MRHRNIFGEGTLTNLDEVAVSGKTYIQCAACLSLYAEALSWANAYPSLIAKTPEEADRIVTMSCQVTNLAVLNDIRNAVGLQSQAIYKPNYIAGCLAHRFDIEMPPGILRMDHIRMDYQHLDDMSLVNYLPPFWVENFVEGGGEGDGYRMRGQYPLRIGAGCSQRCAYCTIRVTRGQPYYLTDLDRLEKEFLDHNDVVLISDNPSPDQIQFWCAKALEHGKGISIRNVEPQNALKAWDGLQAASEEGVLEELHMPIQSLTPKILKEMKRPAAQTLHAALRAQKLRRNTHISTNIIRDEENPLYNKYDEGLVYELFDTVSWNPMWDGKWDLGNSRESFYRLFPWHKEG